MLMLGFTSYLSAQCLTAIEGQYPSTTYTVATCDGLTQNDITTSGWASEYSVVNVTLGETYTFGSSNPTDIVTISSDAGVSADAFGTGSVTWVSTITGEVSFYTNLDDGVCGGEQLSRTRYVICGTPPSCIPPTGLVSSNLTTDSATISWTASVTEPGNGYEYYLSTSNTAPVTTDTATGNVQAAITTVDLSSLSAATTYYVWIRSVCSGTDSSSSWSSVINFTTLCSAYTPSYIQAFDSFPPSCWTRSNAGDVTTGPTGTGNGIWTSDGFLNAGSSGATKVNLYSTARIGWLISPTFDLSNGGYRLKFDYAVTAWGATTPSAMGSDDTVELVMSEDGGANWVSLNLFNANSNISNVNNTFIYDLTSNVSANTKFAIVANDGTVNDAEDYDFFIDNFIVETNPACDTPYNVLVSNIVFDSANISWVAPSGTPLGYEYVLDTVSTDPTTSGTSINTLDYSAISLDPSTTYYFHVRSMCAVGVYSNWVTVSFTTPEIPPVNDDCSNAIVINCGDTLTGETTAGATGGTSTSCVGTIGDDIWYSYEGDGQIITLTATSTNSEGPQVEVYESTDGTCSGFTPGSCLASGGSGSTTTAVTFVSVVGKTYYTHIGSWINGNPAVVFDLAVTCVAPATPPANDDCAGAESLSVNLDTSCALFASGTVNGATASSVDATSCSGTEDDDVWYSFTALDTLQSINLSNVAGSSTGMSYSVWSGDCSSLVLVPGSCSSANSSVVTGLTPGDTYFVRVFTTTATVLQNTTFDICIGTPPSPPLNDDCTGAIAITPGAVFADYPVVGTTVSATTTAGLTYSCQTSRVNDVWYSVVVPASGTLTVETDASTGTTMTDSVLTVFSGTCGSLTEVGCDDDAGNLNFSKVVLSALTPGDTLYIGVWRYSLGTGVDGEFQLSAYDASLSNNTFANSNFTFYPNPVKDILNVSNSTIISKVQVVNLLGQEMIVKSMNETQGQVDMSQLSAGTYLVKVTSDNQVKTIKVVKE